MSNIDFLPPNDQAAEQGLLGSALMNPQQVIPDLMAFFGGMEKPFYDLRHQTIWEVIAELSDTNPNVDIITLQGKLKDRLQLEAVGGLAYLSSLPDATPSAENWRYYAQIVRDKAVKRKLIQACQEVVAKIMEEPDAPLDAVVDAAEASVMSASGVRSDSKGEKGIREYTREAVALIEREAAAGGRPTGLATGLHGIDQLTGGLHAPEMTVVAARPSGGKSTLGMNLIENAVFGENEHVCVVSLEMTGASLVRRMIYGRARVASRDWGKPMTDPERDSLFRRLAIQTGTIAKSNLHIIDTQGMSIIELRSRIRRLHKRLGFKKDKAGNPIIDPVTGNPEAVLKGFVVDYLQLMHSTSKKASNSRVQEVADISHGIKNLCKELNVWAIVLAQLNRESEKENRKPRMSDLRECGDIEQDADVVGLIWDKDKPDEEVGEIGDGSRNYVYIIAKQREGPRGDVTLFFNKQYTRFDNPAKVAEEDLPSMPYKD